MYISENTAVIYLQAAQNKQTYRAVYMMYSTLRMTYPCWPVSSLVNTLLTKGVCRAPPCIFSITFAKYYLKMYSKTTSMKNNYSKHDSWRFDSDATWTVTLTMRQLCTLLCPYHEPAKRRSPPLVMGLCNSGVSRWQKKWWNCKEQFKQTAYERKVI